MTCVVPTGKLLPGSCDLVTVGVIPELSVAVGSIQVAIVVEAPRGRVYCMDSGHPLIMGMSESTSVVTSE